MTTSEYVLMNESEEILATYNLVLIGKRRVEPGLLGLTDGLHPSFVRETEENLTDLLPAGYRVVIREWNETEETP